MDRFERLLIGEIPRLRRYARALTGDSARGDDLVQDCLERAMTRRRLWMSDRELRPWLFAIMHNLNANEARRAAARASTLERYEGAHPEPGAGTAAEPEGMRLRDLDRILATLPAEQRETLLLVGLEGLSYKETASVLGVAIGTVMSRLSRARARLVSALEPPDSGSTL